MRALILAVFSLCVTAQTVSVFAIVDGKITFVKLGEGVSLSRRGADWVIVAAPVPPKLRQVKVSKLPDNTYPAPTGAFKFVGNGLTLVENDDYRIENGKLIPQTTWYVGWDLTAYILEPVTTTP